MLIKMKNPQGKWTIRLGAKLSFKLASVLVAVRRK